MLYLFLILWIKYWDFLMIRWWIGALHVKARKGLAYALNEFEVILQHGRHAE